jgi:PAN domain
MKRFGAVFCSFVLFVTAAMGQMKTLKEGGMAPNTNLAGSDVGRIVLRAPGSGQLDTREQQCAAACWADARCRSWTYVRPNTIQGPDGNCWLKNTTPAPSAGTCCVSGTIGQPNTNRYGGDYRSFDAVAPQQCATACLYESQCRAWTFVKAGIQVLQRRRWVVASAGQQIKAP